MIFRRMLNPKMLQVKNLMVYTSRSVYVLLISFERMMWIIPKKKKITNSSMYVITSYLFRCAKFHSLNIKHIIQYLPGTDQFRVVEWIKMFMDKWCVQKGCMQMWCVQNWCVVCVDNWCVHKFFSVNNWFMDDWCVDDWFVVHNRGMDDFFMYNWCTDNFGTFNWYNDWCYNRCAVEIGTALVWHTTWYSFHEFLNMHILLYFGDGMQFNGWMMFNDVLWFRNQVRWSGMEMAVAWSGNGGGNEGW